MNFITFDIEEWFHIPGHQVHHKHWNKLEYRAEFIIDKLLCLLDNANTKAIFLILGWFAEEQPNIVRKIHSHGHVIGSHSNYHDLVYEMTPEQFSNDLQQSIKSISDIIGDSVSMYRAPSFSVTPSSIKWFFDTLISCGIKYDLSIFPANRIRGGFSGMPSQPFIYRNGEGLLRCLPISVHKALGFNFVYSGGGYFRLLPYSLLKYFFSRASYNMSYFHPHDFDKTKPLPEGMNLLSVFRRRYGVDSLFIKLSKLLDDYTFRSFDIIKDDLSYSELDDSFYKNYVNHYEVIG